MSVDSELIDSATYMGLHREATTDEAKGFVRALAKTISGGASKTPTRVSRPFLRALEALVADLLVVAQRDPKAFGYRPVSSKSFSDHRLGHDAFRRAYRELEERRFIEVVLGSGGGTAPPVATRFRALPSLIDAAALADVTLADLSRHFGLLPRPQKVREPLTLKKGRAVPWLKVLGGSIPVDLTKEPERTLAKQVNDLNEFFSSVRIEPEDAHWAFYRVFNQGDLPKYRWNKGGRLISAGYSYQQWHKDKRAKLTLNGEQVVELDIRASHLTILHALSKKPFSSPAKDPYLVSGLPREIVKAWVTMTLGYDRYQSRWSQSVRKDFRKGFDKSAPEDMSKDVQKEYPIQMVRSEVLAAIPILADWETCPFRWGDLQFYESQAIVAAVHELATTHKVPALPVHDSLIVPVSHQELARTVLGMAFESVVGVEPSIQVK